MCCLHISHDIYCSCFMLLSKQVPTPLTWAYLTQLDTRECSWQGYINGSKEPRRERQLRNSCEAAKRRWAWLTWVLSTFVVGPRDMSSLFQSPNSHPFLLSIVRLLVGRQGSISNLWLNVTTLNLNDLFDMQNASKCFFLTQKRMVKAMALLSQSSHLIFYPFLVFFFVTMSNNHWSLWGKLSFCHEAEIDLDLPDTRLHC